MIRLLPKLVTRLLSLLFILCLYHEASAFKAPLTQSLSMPTYYFPQFTGWHGGLGVHALSRQQWVGFESSPRSYGVEVDGYVRPIRSGLGLVFVRDAAGLSSTNDLTLNIAPKIKVGQSLTLTPAASLRFYQSRFDFNASQSLVWNSFSAGAGVGAIYRGTFIASHIDVYENNQEYRYFISAIAGRNFYASDHLSITPSVVYHGSTVTYNSTVTQTIEFNANAQYRWFYVGATYRWNALLGFAAGYEWNERIRIGYSYDFFTSRLGTSLNGSHEITLRALLFRDKGTKRFLQNLPLI